MDINKALLVGRLTRDPEARTTPSGINVTSFGIATNFVWNDPTGQRKEQVEFHNVVAWRKLGEIVAQYLRKGSRVLIEGRLQTRSWEGQDGSKRYRTEIVADNLVMLDSKGASSSDGYQAPAAQPQASRTNNAPTPQASAPADSAMDTEEISVEDIPF